MKKSERSLRVSSFLFKRNCCWCAMCQNVHATIEHGGYLTFRSNGIHFEVMFAYTMFDMDVFGLEFI